MSTTQSLFRKLPIFLDKRGTEGLKELKKNSFGVFFTNKGREYLQLTCNEKTKKCQGDEMYDN